MPKISIIVPVYNVEKYIDRCMNSIINQSFTDFECILIDDGSPDNCPAICDKYAKQDDRFIVIHKENGGVSSARNMGLDRASGEYIIFVDPDDYIADDTLLKVNELMNDDTDIIAFNYITINQDNKVIWNRGYKDKTYSLVPESDWIEVITKEVLSNNIGWEIWNKAFKRNIIEEKHIRLDTSMAIGEDLYFLVQYLLYAKNIKTLDLDLYYYVIRENSAMQKNVESKINDFVNFNYKFYKTVKENKYNYIAKKYYLFFYMTMNIRYMQAGFEKTLEDIPRIEKKSFYKKFEKKIIFNAEDVFNHQDRDTKSGIITEAIYHYAYASNKTIKNILLSVLRKK